jgi:predicted nucleotidyltransferase
MEILETLKNSIDKVGIKEVARRTGLAPSTISRVNSGLIRPSFEVAEKISLATGFYLELHPETGRAKAPRLEFAKDILGRLRKELKALGVRHAVIFGSVARKEDKANSDIDIYLDFGESVPSVTRLLKAEGRVIESFGETRVDVIGRLKTPRALRLRAQIERDGVRVF